MNEHCTWIWHDGEEFHYCPLLGNHQGRHARNDGTIPTEAEVADMEGALT